MLATNARDSTSIFGTLSSTWKNRSLWWPEKKSPRDVALLHRCKSALGQPAVQETEGRPAAAVARRRLQQLGFNSQLPAGERPPLKTPDHDGDLASICRSATIDSCSPDARDPGVLWRPQSFTVLSDGAGSANKPLLLSMHSAHGEPQIDVEVPIAPVGFTNAGVPLLLESQPKLAEFKPSSQPSKPLLRSTALAHLSPEKGLFVDHGMDDNGNQGDLEAFMRNVHSAAMQPRGAGLARVHQQQRHGSWAPAHLLHARPRVHNPMQHVGVFGSSRLGYTNASFPRSGMQSTVCPALSRWSPDFPQPRPRPFPKVLVRSRTETGGVPSTRGLELHALHLASQQSAFTLSAVQLSPRGPMLTHGPLTRREEPSHHHTIPSVLQTPTNVLYDSTEGGSVYPLLGKQMAMGCSTCWPGHASLAGGDACSFLLRELHPEPPLSVARRPHLSPGTGFSNRAQAALQPCLLCHNTGFDPAPVHLGEVGLRSPSEYSTADTLHASIALVKCAATSQASASSLSSGPNVGSCDARQSVLQQPHCCLSSQKADLGPSGSAPFSTATRSGPESDDVLLSHVSQLGGSLRVGPCDTCERSSDGSPQKEEQALPMVDQGSDTLFQEYVSAHAQQGALQREEAHSSGLFSRGCRSSPAMPTMLEHENETTR